MLKRYSLLFFVLIFTLTLQAKSFAYESISYLYAGNTTTYIKNVERTGTSLTTVCPDYFEISSSGTLVNTIKVDPLFVQTMHSKGIKVFPYLSNNWNRTLGRLAVANRASFVTELSNKVKSLGCDGVNIDIQNLTEVDRDNFTDFLRLLRSKLPASIKLSVCVAANPWGTTKGWQGSYDYTALGTICDQVFVMTYDESYTGSKPGAVASYSFVEKSIIDVLKHVPSSKVILGIPFYGRYWKEGASTGGYGITISDIERLTTTYTSKTWYDTTYQCARATLTISATDNATIWGSNKLSAGVYDIWYENDTSLEKKLSLVSKYNLLGAGSWALGQEPDRVWQNYSAWLLGKPFNDINNHWAQSYIIDLYKKGIVKGLSNNRFEPNKNLTRAEAAALLVKMLGLQNESGAGSFSDTKGHWGEKQISIAKQYGIFMGYNNNLFYPDKFITREEFAVVADKVLLHPDTVDFSQRIFSDVSPETNTWSNKSIIVLSQNNIISGYPNGTFKPKNLITRAEAVRVVSSLLDYPGGFSISPAGIKTPTPVPPR